MHLLLSTAVGLYSQHKLAFGGATRFNNVITDQVGVPPVMPTTSRLFVMEGLCVYLSMGFRVYRKRCGALFVGNNRLSRIISPEYRLRRCKLR